jgi:hypothetical protein
MGEHAGWPIPRFVTARPGLEPTNSTLRGDQVLMRDPAAQWEAARRWPGSKACCPRPLATARRDIVRLGWSSRVDGTLVVTVGSAGVIGILGWQLADVVAVAGRGSPTLQFHQGSQRICCPRDSSSWRSLAAAAVQSCSKGTRRPDSPRSSITMGLRRFALGW